jgi:LacI family transcriptional regulator
MPSSSQPTLADVARHAGVSTATVSRCINEPDRVVPETRQKVLAAIEALSYTPNFGGRALASRRTMTVGAVIPTMENAIFARGIQAFEEELAKAGYTLLVASTDYDPKREFDQIQALIARGADGLLLIGLERPAATDAYLKARKFPTVIAWSFRADTRHLYSGFHNHLAAQQLARRVLGHGHRRIAMIAGIVSGNDRAADRLAGVREALSKADPPITDLAIIEAEYTFAGGARAIEELLRDGRRPTAIICGNDVLAVGALLHAKSIGLRVPEDISITGFDDIDIASVVEPKLTTVHVPHRRMGRAAAKILIARMADENFNRSEEFDTEIIERGSLGPPPD